MSNQILEQSALKLAQGVHDGDLEGQLFKKRVALLEKDKRGLAKDILAFHDNKIPIMVLDKALVEIKNGKA